MFHRVLRSSQVKCTPKTAEFIFWKSRSVSLLTVYRLRSGFVCLFFPFVCFFKKDLIEIRYEEGMLASLRSKRFQSSYCAKVRAEAKKRKRLLRRLHACRLPSLPAKDSSLHSCIRNDPWIHPHGIVIASFLAQLSLWAWSNCIHIFRADPFIV